MDNIISSILGQVTLDRGWFLFVVVMMIVLVMYVVYVFVFDVMVRDPKEGKEDWKEGELDDGEDITE